MSCPDCHRELFGRDYRNAAGHRCTVFACPCGAEATRLQERQ